MLVTFDFFFALLMSCRVDFCAMMILGASLQLNVGLDQRKSPAVTNVLRLVQPKAQMIMLG